MDSTELDILAQVAVALWGALGCWAAPIIVVMLTVRAIRLDAVQAVVPHWLVWDAWPRPLQWAVVGSLSLVSAAATAVVAGATWSSALWSAIPIAVGAIWGHKSTQWIGHLTHAIASERDPNYEPSPFRKAASIVVPLNPKIPLGVNRG